MSHNALHDEARLPCGCRVWRLGSATDVDLCGEHFHRHERRGESEPHHAKRRCGCLRCRSRRRGLAPWDFIAELVEQHIAACRGRAAQAMSVPDALAGERTCGCVMPVEGGLPRLVRCEQHHREHLLRHVRAQQEASRRLAEMANSIERDLIRGHGEPTPPWPWWRRVLDAALGRAP